LAAAKEPTDPWATNAVMAQLVYDTVLGMGPKVKDFLAPQKQQQSKPAVRALNPSGSSARAARVRTSESLAASAAPVFQSITKEFVGEQMWGKAQVKLLTRQEGFDLQIKCDLPVSLWSLTSADNTRIAQEKVGSRTQFLAQVSEPFTPPYELKLVVDYQGIPTSIKVKLQ
jgi:hypothetical protein